MENEIHLVVLAREGAHAADGAEGRVRAGRCARPDRPLLRACEGGSFLA